MRSGYSVLGFILDRSGSMSTGWQGAMSGFDEFVQAQRNQPGTADLTVVVFDDFYDVLLNGVALDTVKPFHQYNVAPRGMTALYDAIGRTIITMGKRLEAMNERDRPEHVIVAILTDGQENASREFNQEQIAEMIKHQEETYKWQFLFLGANIDVQAVAKGLNIQAGNAVMFNSSNNIGTQTAMLDTSDRITRMRSS